MSTTHLPAELTTNSERALPRALLVCGLLSSVLYVVMNVFVAMRWEGYSSASQTVSELSAIGAPTRPLWVALGALYTLLVIAFGGGVWASAREHRRLRVVGGLLIAYGVTSMLWPFVPMHLRGAQATLSDALHIALAMVTVALMLLAMGFGAAALGKRFRLYSIATMVTLALFGALTATDAPRIAANLPTPWMGVWERLNIAAFLLWIVVLDIAILRGSPGRSAAR